MKKRLLALLVVIILSVCICVPALADFDPATRNSVAVVYTCLDLDGGEYGFGWGSCFFVGEPGQNPTYLITNYHVIEDFVDFGQGELTTVMVNGQQMNGRAKIRVHYDSRDYEEGYVVGYDSLKDIAVLKLGSPTTKRTALPLQVPTDAMVGSTVYAVGYPGLAENVFADATSSWSSSDSTVTRGTISRLFLTSGTGVASVQIDCDIKNGNSGGPLVSDNGTVVGINTWGVENGNNESINYAINISEAIPLLNQYSVPYVTGSASTTPANPEGTDQPVAPTAPAQGGFPLWAIILIAAVVVVAIVVVVIVLVTRGKKNRPAPAAQPVQPPVQQPMRPAAPTRNAYVRSLSSQHRGNRIPVGGQPILLGRGQDCAVVYQANTPGVSGHHCSLAWNPATSDFILTDLQSTYGTYLQSGQKLTPNAPYHLRPGEQFYLGDRANMVQVSVE